jgi:hypothetical protein
MQEVLLKEEDTIESVTMDLLLRARSLKEEASRLEAEAWSLKVQDLFLSGIGDRSIQASKGYSCDRIRAMLKAAGIRIGFRARDGLEGPVYALEKKIGIEHDNPPYMGVRIAMLENIIF